MDHIPMDPGADFICGFVFLLGNSGTVIGPLTGNVNVAGERDSWGVLQWWLVWFHRNSKICLIHFTEWIGRLSFFA